MDSFEWVESNRQQVYCPARMKRRNRSKRYEFVGWGSRPLIEFLESIGKDISEKISRHDVTSIINEYVNINNLLHPSRKKRILCDERLHSIFGRRTIGRIKIHDMLEPHFAENQDESDDDFSSNSDETENFFNTLKRENGITTERKYRQKTRVLVNPKSRFAAMVPGNINLVYLRKSLVEDLLADSETFESKMIGSFVRIKSDPHDYLQKNTHQLVQVIGVKKISISSDTSTKFLLHVSNVVKDIDICMLSDEKFSEEECKDLNLRVKHGLLKRLTIAEVQQKAQVLHVDITKHWLLREISLLQNLIDQANEKGWRRELDQYLERKQLLQTADEQSRLFHETPQVIADETELEPELQMGEEVSDYPNQGENVSLSPSSTPGEISKFAIYVAENRSAALMSNIEPPESKRSVLNEERPQQSVESMRNSNKETKVISEVKKGCQQLVNEQIIESIVIDLSDDDEQPRAEERDPTNNLRSLIWNYLDPRGDVQGPFSLMSLKNWKDADYFPSDFKVWKTGQNQDEAVLLNDIISHNFHD